MGLAALVLASGASQEVKTFDQAKAWNAFNKQLEFGVRVPGTSGHLKCRDWLLEQVKENCENARLQPFSHAWSVNRQKVSMWNVIGEQNWSKAKVRVLLLAHWDTRPYADQEYDETKASKPIAGANDGASGVAVLLELMRVMKDRLPEDVGVMYLFTDGEDLGPQLDEMFIGAKAFAREMPKPKPTYGILLDMIGDKNLEVPMEPNSYAYAPGLMKALYAHAASVGLGKTFPMKRGPYIEDDHIPLNQAGLPVIDLIDFDYPSWHTLEDTADKCSADSLGKVGKLLETWLVKRPAYSP